MIQFSAPLPHRWWTHHVPRDICPLRVVGLQPSAGVGVGGGCGTVPVARPIPMHIDPPPCVDIGASSGVQGRGGKSVREKKTWFGRVSNRIFVRNISFLGYPHSTFQGLPKRSDLVEASESMSPPCVSISLY